MTSPRVLFLDEPTSGLDSYTANEVSPAGGRPCQRQQGNRLRRLPRRSDHGSPVRTRLLRPPSACR